MTFKKLFESSLSRIYLQSQGHDVGTISAFRSQRDCGEGERFTKNENKANSATLKKELLNLGYSVTKIAGTYIEGYGSNNEVSVKEDSYFVIDSQDKGTLEKDLRNLGTKYDQDSITFQSQSNLNSDYYLIGTNKCKNGYPGWNKKIKLGKPIFGKGGEFHSQIRGRSFVFEGEVSETSNILDMFPTEIRSLKHIDEIIK